MAIFLPNLDFEFALAGAPPPGRILDRMASLIPHLGLLLGEGDTLLSPAPFDFPPDFAQRRPLPRVRVLPQDPSPWLFPLVAPRGAPAGALRPWGWDPRADALAEGWPGGEGRRLGPHPAVVARVNGKVFSHHLERALGVVMPGARAFGGSEGEGDRGRGADGGMDARLGEVCAHLSGLGPWVAKASLGLGGRGRILGRGAPEPNHVQWLRGALPGGIVVEPWVPRLGDLCLQLTVDAEGGVGIDGMAWLLNQRGGQFEGLAFGTGSGRIPAEVGAALRAMGAKVGAALFEAGYWGPAGVDALLYAGEGGEPLLRPLVEINARYTFGRVALGAAVLVPEGAGGVWRLRAPEAARRALKMGGILTSPWAIGGEAAPVVGVLEIVP